MGIRQSSTCTALAVCGAQAAWGKEMRGWRLWGCRGRLRAEHLQELVLDSRKQSDIEKEEHVLHAAMQVGQPGFGFATHLERQHTAAQEDRADRVATQQVWVERKHSFDLVIAWRLVFRRGAPAARGGLRAVVWFDHVGGLTKVYAVTISATDMRKRTTSTMTN